MTSYSLSPVRPTTACLVPPPEAVYANGNGYNKLRATMQYAHRAAYERVHGSIPAGLVIDHLCRNTQCWNPEHLEAVPPAINALRADSPPTRNAQKAVCRNGHPFSMRANGRRWCPTCSLERRIAKGETSGAGPLSLRSYCPQGHLFDEANTRYDRRPDGSIRGRRCRECQRERDQRRRGTSAARQGRAA